MRVGAAALPLTLPLGSARTGAVPLLVVLHRGNLTVLDDANVRREVVNALGSFVRVKEESAAV